MTGFKGELIIHCTAIKVRMISVRLNLNPGTDAVDLRAEPQQEGYLG